MPTFRNSLSVPSSKAMVEHGESLESRVQNVVPNVSVPCSEECFSSSSIGGSIALVSDQR